jgi:mono/diheme cytochrome c family protein
MIRTHHACVLILLATSACVDAGADAGGALAAATPVPAVVPAVAASQPDGGSGAVPDEEHAEGLRIYREQYCGTCHAFAAAGTAGIFGPPHDDMRAIAQQRIREATYAGRATSVEEYLRESLIEPGAYRVPGYERTRFLMPAYTNLTETQVDALVRFLLQSPVDGGT